MVQISAMYSEWPGHYNNVECSASLKTSFELNPVTDGKQGTYTSAALQDYVNDIKNMLLINSRCGIN